MAQHARHARNSRPQKRTLALFAAVALVWFAIDRTTKVAFSSYQPGDLIAANLAGLFDFRMVHNTGAAWGMFGNSTFALGIFSIAICILVLIYILAIRKGRGNAFEACSLALVFAGGLGNAFDRLSLGYVVDFIQTTFIDFPVFNIADIGVTCGIVCFLIYTLTHHEERDETDGIAHD